MVQIIYPPRPKGKMLPSDLPFYEKTGKWLAQRKFRGSRAVLNISSTGEITLGNRHGTQFARFTLSKERKDEILSSLRIRSGIEYWFDGELMNKDENATNEIILFDVLQVDRYFFGTPTQIERLEILRDICGNPQNKCRSGIALEVSPNLWLAETFDKNFVERYNEALPIPQLEGLLLRKKLAGLDNFGHSEYETSNQIRCRKPFGCDTPKVGRSGGYAF